MITNLIEKIFSWHDNNPEAIANYFYTDDNYKKTNLHDWLQEIKKIAAYLQNNFPARSNIAVILPSEHCNDFLTIFVATLVANMVAIPMAPPENNDKHNLNNQRINHILTKTKPKAVIATDKIFKLLNEAAVVIENTKINLTTISSLEINNLFAIPTLPQHEAAFIQFTSGSTGKVKGVMITHANIAANVNAMKNRLIENNITIEHVVNWLPHYHDMGLISGMLLPLFLNVPSILIPTKKFIMDPMLWLKTISKFPHVLSGGPDFAYSLCVRAAKRSLPEELKLENWEIAFIGAQMIQPDTFTKFKDIFSKFGFRENRFYPCYGLAESTLYATGGNLNLEPKVKQINDHSKVFCVGTAFAEHDLLIVDPDSLEILSDNSIGEIWLQGPSIAAGYYKDPEATNYTFNAITADEQKYFLRTGDLGLLDAGELYVVGRLKDMVIVHGKNYPCTDLEWCAVQSHEALRENHCAAFSTMKDGKNICVIIAETHPSFAEAKDEITRKIREALSEQMGIKVNDIVLTEPRVLAKTSSGKLRRFKIKENYLAGKYS